MDTQIQCFFQGNRKSIIPLDCLFVRAVNSISINAIQYPQTKTIFVHSLAYQTRTNIRMYVCVCVFVSVHCFHFLARKQNAQ